ncbi:MAG: DUF4304 domain-containing protein [Anaerolineales bacterium]
MKTSEKYKALINNVAAPLKKLEFIKDRYRFYLYQNSNWGVVDFQKSVKSNSDTIVFAVNIGVASGRLLEKFSSIHQGKKPAIWNCHWRIRLGHLVDHKDTWWSIDNETSIDYLSKQISDYILLLGIPEMNKYITDEALRDLWLSGKSPSLTETERLEYLLALVREIGPSNAVAAIESDIRSK